LYKIYLKPAILDVASLDKTIEAGLAMLLIYFLVGMFWISARTLCEAELGRKVSTFSVIGTCMQFFFIFIGAPFIYLRLRKLSEPIVGGTAEVV